MPIAPGYGISNSRVFWASGGSGGGGSDSGPPTVIAPFPGIGAEGTYYAQQVRTTGATPQTFAVTSEELPPGLSLDAASGIISGVCVYPDGGLYPGTITVTNAAGSVDYDFSILISGTTPTLSYSTAYGAFPSGTLFASPGGVDNLFSATVTGSTGGNPAVPLEFVPSTVPAGANVTVDQATGELNVLSPAGANGNSYTYTISCTNYFGSVSFSKTLYVLAPIYWGEWHGALPGTFTEADILTGLFNDTTPGPRVIEDDHVYELIVGNIVSYPTTADPYYRVLALPVGLLTGTLAQAQGDGSPLMPYGPPGGLAEFDPPWPDTYQPELVINGVPYQIFVYAVGATTTGFDLFLQQNLAPVPPLIRTTVGFSDFLLYLGDSRFLAAGRQDLSDTKIKLETYLGLGPFTWDGSGTLPDGLTWNSATQEITGTPTNSSQVFERFIFNVTATNAGGLSNTVTLHIVLANTIFYGELNGALPGSFTEADIVTGLYNGTTPGPRVYDSTVLTTPAIGFGGIILPGFYGHSENVGSSYPALFGFPLTASVQTRVLAVPQGFFTGSWAQDPYGVGQTKTYNPSASAIFGSTGTMVFNPAWPGGPYQSGLSITVNGIAGLYDIYVLEGSSGFSVWWT